MPIIENILDFEQAVLSAFKQEVCHQTKLIAPCRNPLYLVEPKGVISDIKTNIKIYNDMGYGHRDENYIFTIKLIYNEFHITATIKYSYSGGSCEACDPVQKALDKYFDYNDTSYASSQIETLKFTTFVVM